MLPTKIFTTTDIGPPMVLEQIKKSGVEFHVFNSPHSFDDILVLIDDISNVLNLNKEANLLKKELLILNNKVVDIKSNYSNNPKMVFFMNPVNGSYTAAGSETRADYLIEFIGGDNIFSAEFNRYSKVSKEQIIKFNPDVILVGSISSSDENLLESIFLDDDDFGALSAIINNAVFSLDMGQLLSFGPTFVSNALELLKRVNFDNANEN
tara:strand:- start:5 stop:631 length:627 start_codon:yes stop_codon:yes gene_type:complete